VFYILTFISFTGKR